MYVHGMHQSRSTISRPDSVRSLRFSLIVFLVAQIPLALLMHQAPFIATLHALATLAVGLWLAVFDSRLERVAYLGAYISGAEVLWRMANAQVFWEFGKYATAVIFIVAMLRFRRLKGPMLPFLYFILLLPSATLTMMNIKDPVEAREQISFNLSGPLALMISAWFFSRLKLSAEQLQRLFLALIGPALGIGAITLFTTLTTPDIVFTGQSNFATSGGFGPNQVSAALGLGALVAFFCILDSRASRWLRILLFGAVMFLAVQSAMTFSRGGLYNAAMGAVLAFLFLVRDIRRQVQFVLVGALLFVVTDYILLPRLDAFTDGALSARFQDVNPTGRDSIVQSDLEIWEENPLLGVGPGLAKAQRELQGVAAHTEFTRLLAEHGALGLVALLLLLVSVAQNLSRARAPKDKALAASMMGWSLLFMLNAAMRLVAPSFTFGLAFATLRPERKLGLNRVRNSGYKSARYLTFSPARSVFENLKTNLF